METGKVLVHVLLLCLGEVVVPHLFCISRTFKWCEFQLRGALGLRDDICIERGPNGKQACKNIYIWERDREDFVAASGGKMASAASGDPHALRGKTVRVIADNMLPYITSDNETQELGGYLGDIWTIIEKTLGFKSNVTSVNYDAGVELMIHKKADIMLAAAIEKRGQPNIQYSQPYFYNWYHLYMKQPEPKASSNSYIKIFNYYLWLATLCLAIILVTTLWFSAKCINATNRKEPILSVASCILVVCSGFINQGYEVRTSSYSTRMQIFFALFTGFLLYSAMNAVLVARLANLEIELPFSNLQDIAAKRTHFLCLRSNSFVYNNFTDANKTILPMWQGTLNGRGCLDINNQTNLARSVCNDGVIFLENRVVMATIIKTHDLPCSITFLPEKLFMKPNSFILLKKFLQKKHINAMVKKLKSIGILKRLENKWVERYEPSKANSGTVPQVTIHHISGLLNLYGAAIFMSVIILSLETLCRRFSKRNIFPFIR